MLDQDCSNARREEISKRKRSSLKEEEQSLAAKRRHFSSSSSSSSSSLGGTDTILEEDMFILDYSGTLNEADELNDCQLSVVREPENGGRIPESVLTEDVASQPKRICSSKLKKDSRIGVGMFGIVSHGTLVLEDGQIVEVAIKERNRSRATYDTMVREALLLRDIDGTCGVPRLYGVTDEKIPAIVMEFCPGVTYARFCRENSRLDGLKAFVAACKTLQEFHDAGFAHRDFHGGNIMIEEDAGNGLRCRLIDAGNSKRIVDRIEDGDALEEDYGSLRILGNRLDLSLKNDERYNYFIDGFDKRYDPNYIRTVQQEATNVNKLLE